MRSSPTTLGAIAGAQHQRNVGAVDVGVEQADFVAHARQRDGQIYRERGFADAAFTGANGDDAVDAGKRLRRCRRLAGCVCVLMTHEPS